MRVRQIDKVLDLFEMYARERAPMTLTQVAKQIGIPKSSAFNIIETLMQRGYLYETRPRSGYYPTALLYELSRAVTDADPLMPRLRPELESLAATTGETVLLSMRENNEIIYLDVVESALAIRYNARIGQRKPLHTTSSGKAILFSYDAAERRGVLEMLRGLAPVDLDKLNSDLDTCAARGWAEDHGETLVDVMGFGVPILTGRWRLGLAIAGPAYRIDAARKTLIEQLLSSRDKILGENALASRTAV